MMPERSPERDAAIEAMLPAVPESGWTIATLRRAAGPDADLMFPGGSLELVETYCDLADRWMEADAAVLDMTEMRTPARVRAVIACRLSRAAPDREAVRRALAVLALPGRAGLAARFTARTVDAIWAAVGDDATGFSRISKRAILGAVYGTTLLYWLRDDSWDAEDTMAFLDRRLADTGRIGRLRRRLTGAATPG